jgi:hypothetical protein
MVCQPPKTLVQMGIGHGGPANSLTHLAPRDIPPFQPPPFLLPLTLPFLARSPPNTRASNSRKVSPHGHSPSRHRQIHVFSPTLVLLGLRRSCPSAALTLGRLLTIFRRNNRCMRLPRSRSSICEKVPYPHRVLQVHQQTSLYQGTFIRARSSAHSQQTLAGCSTNIVNPAFSSSFRIYRFGRKVCRVPPLSSLAFKVLQLLTRSGVCGFTGRFRLRLRLMNVGALV